MRISLHYLAASNSVPAVSGTLGHGAFLMVPYFIDSFVLVKECDATGETTNLFPDVYSSSPSRPSTYCWV